MNVPLRNSAYACSSSASVFITIGPYQASLASSRLICVDIQKKREIDPIVMAAFEEKAALTDPQAALTSKGRSKITFAYGTNCLIEEPSPARWTAEVAATRTMIERTKSRFDLQPEKLAADTGYGSGGNLAWLMERGIEPRALKSLGEGDTLLVARVD